MNSMKKIVLSILILVMFSVPICMSGISDGGVTRSEVTSVSGFDDMNDGTIRYTLKNDTMSEVEVTVKVIDFQTKEIYKTTTAVVPASTGETDGTAVLYLTFGFGSAGTKYVDIVVSIGDTELEGASDYAVRIDVGDSIWNNASTYIVFVAILIVFIAAIAIYLRSVKKTKADMAMENRTFTKLHNEKMAKKSAEKRSYAPSENKSRRKE